MIARGVRERDLILVEANARFADALRLRFPQARLVAGDAARLCIDDVRGDKPIGAVISGLPLLNMPLRQIYGILTAAFDLLELGGALYQFTYGVRCPVPRRVLDRLGLKAVSIGLVVRNIPPATVYRIARRGQLRRDLPCR